MPYDDALESGERDLDTGRDDYDDDDRDDDVDAGATQEGAQDDEGDGKAADDGSVEADARDEESAESRAERRRAKRRAEKEWRRKVNEHNAALIQQQAREISELRAMVSGVVQRTDMEQLDSRLSQAQTAYRHAQMKLRDAIESGDIDQQIKLQDDLYTARRSVDDLTVIKERAAQQARQPQQPVQPRVNTAKLAAFQEAFFDENAWFDRSLRDDDSRAAAALSERIAGEGYAPDTVEHWRELKARLRQQMPHRFGGKTGAATQRPAARSPVGGSGRSTQAGGNADDIRIPREYREMLEQSGDWADPKRRKAMIDEYKASAKRHGV